MSKDKNFSQEIIEEMLKSKKTQIQGFEKKVKDIEQKKVVTEEYLETLKKENEAKFLLPILEKSQKCSKQLEDSKAEFEKMLIKELVAFEKGKKHLPPHKLLKEYVYFQSLGYKTSGELDKKAQCLFEYFLSSQDVQSAVTFLKSRSRTTSKEFEEDKKLYLSHMEEHPIPEVTSNASCILGYGEYRNDILSLFELCGKLDHDAMPKGFTGTYISPQTKDLIASACIGEFGQLARHVYYDFPHGFETKDSDRSTIMYWHEQGFQREEKSALSSK